MNYICLKNQEFKTDSYRMLPIRMEDIFLIKQWRNEQIDILRQNVLLTDDMQKIYFENVIKPLFLLAQPDQILFSILKEGHFIGYGGLVHIDWNNKMAELSFLVETIRSKQSEIYKVDFSAFLTMIKKVAFNELNFHRIFAETYDIRPLHISVLENEGFKYEKRLKDHVEIQGKLKDAFIHGYRQ
jgi:RimJ/RimL family protein N-acetyltransferase